MNRSDRYQWMSIPLNKLRSDWIRSHQSSLWIRKSKYIQLIRWQLPRWCAMTCSGMSPDTYGWKIHVEHIYLSLKTVCSISSILRVKIPIELDLPGNRATHRYSRCHYPIDNSFGMLCFRSVILFMMIERKFL